MTALTELGASSICALMLNPSLDEEGSTSYAVLQAVAERRGWNRVEVANLFPVRTRNSKVLAAMPVTRSDIMDARPRLDAALAGAAEVLFAWGVSSLPGERGKFHREQVEWVVSRAVLYGHESAWMMGGATRHPSRWRQYVGPQRALVAGASTAERLDRALVRRPVWDAVRAMSVGQGRVDGHNASEGVRQT